MKKQVFRALSALLSLLLGCVPMQKPALDNWYAYLGQNIPSESIAHTALSFSELPLLPADPALLSDRIKRLSARIEAGEGAAMGWQSELASLYSMLRELESDASLAYVRHCLDTGDAAWTERSERLNEALDGLYAELNALALRLSSLPTLRREYPPETVCALETAASLYDDAIAPLLQEEQRILSDYDAMLGSFSIEYEGERWDEQRLTEDRTLPFAAWYAIRRAFDAAFAQKAAELYLALLSVRNRIAKELGFADYPSYRYVAYGRDYTPAEAVSFCAAARDRLAPLYRKTVQQTAADREVLLLAAPQRTDAEWLAAVGETVAAIDPGLSEPWEYMLSHGMLDVSRSQNKLPGSFTTYFAAYETPFLYLSWEDSYADPTVLLHEFGHFASYYRRGDAADLLDLAETDSQGLEMLALSHYERLYGNRAAEARAVKQCDMLYAILSGCACDAFEQAAYAMTDPSAEALCTLFESLCKEYGLDYAGFSCETWTRIPHLFRAPCYYISYASGATAALSLCDLVKENPARAAEAYRKLIGRKDADRPAVLRRCGLTDFLSEDAILRVAALYET